MASNQVWRKVVRLPAAVVNEHDPLPLYHFRPERVPERVVVVVSLPCFCLFYLSLSLPHSLTLQTRIVVDLHHSLCHRVSLTDYKQRPRSFVFQTQERRARNPASVANTH
jgi:hypothetical protein